MTDCNLPPKLPDMHIFGCFRPYAPSSRSVDFAIDLKVNVSYLRIRNIIPSSLPIALFFRCGIVCLYGTDELRRMVMNATCSVIRNGNSAAVVLPSEWRKRFGVQIGDTLSISMPSDGEISFSVQRKDDDAIAAAEDLLSTIDSLPDIPWLCGDSPDDDRELVSQRYV